jgi:hypothetical protein
MTIVGTIDDGVLRPYNRSLSAISGATRLAKNIW